VAGHRGRAARRGQSHGQRRGDAGHRADGENLRPFGPENHAHPPAPAGGLGQPSHPPFLLFAQVRRKM